MLFRSVCLHILTRSLPLEPPNFLSDEAVVSTFEAALSELTIRFIEAWRELPTSQVRRSRSVPFVSDRANPSPLGEHAGRANSRHLWTGLGSRSFAPWSGPIGRDLRQLPPCVGTGLSLLIDLYAGPRRHAGGPALGLRPHSIVIQGGHLAKNVGAVPRIWTDFLADQRLT